MEKEMKCVFCGGNARVEFEDVSLHGGKIILKSQPYYKCIKCNKEFVSREQMIESEKEIKQGFSFVRPVISTGRSAGITFPSDLAEFYGLKKGKTIRLIPEGKQSMKLLVQ